MSAKVFFLLLQDKLDPDWYEKFMNSIQYKHTWNQNYYCIKWKFNENKCILMNFTLHSKLLKDILDLLKTYWDDIYLLFTKGNESNTWMTIQFENILYDVKILVLKKKKNWFIEDHYEKLMKIIENNSIYMYKFWRELLANEHTEYFDNTKLIYPFNIKFQEEISYVSNEYNIYLNNQLSDSCVGISQIEYKEINFAGHPSIYCLMSLYNKLSTMNNMAYGQEAYLKYINWIDNQVYTVFEHISNLYTASVNNLFGANIAEFNNLADYKDFEMTDYIKDIMNTNNLLVDSHCVNGLVKDIKENIFYWIKLCKLHINMKQSNKQKGKAMIHILENRIPDYYKDEENPIKWDYQSLGKLLN